MVHGQTEEPTYEAVCLSVQAAECLDVFACVGVSGRRMCGR